MFRIVSIWLLTLLLFNCSEKSNVGDRVESENIKVMDTHSYAQPDQAKMTHLDIRLKVDFDKRIISGLSEITFEKSITAESITLDTKDLINCLLDLPFSFFIIPIF